MDGESGLRGLIRDESLKKGGEGSGKYCWMHQHMWMEISLDAVEL